MKKLIVVLVMAFGFVLSTNAQSEIKKEAVKTISLEQTKGAFTNKHLTLSEGTYIFEIANNNVGHNVGFVLAPKSDVEAHIKNAYVTAEVKNNTKEISKEVTLKKGDYVYFCPLNPTPHYTLTVK